MRYLLVPSAASSIHVLVERARQLAADAPRVSFVLLTPLPREGSDRDVAQHLAAAHDLLAVARLRRARLRVERSAIGDRSPLLAIEDELRARPDAYDAVVLASPVPRRAARLIGRDDHWRAQALPLPVIHVYEARAGAPSSSSALPGTLPLPLSARARRLATRPRALIRSVARLLQRPRLGFALLLLPIAIYLSVGAGLVLFVNRGFLLTEVLAAVLYSALIAALVIIERTEPRAPTAR